MEARVWGGKKPAAESAVGSMQPQSERSFEYGGHARMTKVLETAVRKIPSLKIL